MREQTHCCGHVVIAYAHAAARGVELCLGSLLAFLRLLGRPSVAIDQGLERRAGEADKLQSLADLEVRRELGAGAAALPRARGLRRALHLCHIATFERNGQRLQGLR